MESKTDIIEKMRGHIQSICDRIGPRPPCSEAERKCAEYIRDEWQKHTDETALEVFACHPDAYRAAFRWPIALFIVSLSLYHLIPPLSFACSAASLLILVFNLMLNRELIDRAFPEKKSCNVHARFDPQGPSDRTLIISCHHDANFAFPIVNRFGSRFGLFMAIVVLSSVLLALLTFLHVLFSITGPESLLGGYHKVAFPFLVLLVATVPIQLYVFLRVISEEPVLGANDNLTGVADCLLLAEHLSRRANRPERTTVWLASFGCEEFGIRGSKRFIEKHRKEIEDAYVLNLDMVGGKGTRLQAVTKEERNLVRLSPKMVRLVEEVARKEGIPLKTGPIIAFTDAMAFAMNGIQATSLIALDDKGIVDTYHSVQDRPEHLDYDLLFASYRLCLAVLQHIDTMPRQGERN
jgi:hypothetical protein